MWLFINSYSFFSFLMSFFFRLRGVLRGGFRRRGVERRGFDFVIFLSCVRSCQFISPWVGRGGGVVRGRKSLSRRGRRGSTAGKLSLTGKQGLFKRPPFSLSIFSKGDGGSITSVSFLIYNIDF